MQLDYSISLDDFRSIQNPFTARAGQNAGFKAVVAVCAAIALLGIFCGVRGDGAALSGFLIGLAVLGAVSCYFLDVASIGKKRARYEMTVAAAYGKLHCRDARQVQADENGMTFSCRCGSLHRPWSELRALVEVEPGFAIRTNAEGYFVPKSAFATPAHATEFRALFLDRLDQGRPWTAQSIEFRQTPEDIQRAKFLHIQRAGGWRRLLVQVATWLVCLAGFVLLWRENSQIAAKMLLPVVVVIGVRFARRRKRPYLGPLKLYFSDEGLNVESPQESAHQPWDKFLGYLEGRYVFLLYGDPRVYRIIPKRALGTKEAAFRTLVQSKLPEYNYRQPVPVS